MTYIGQQPSTTFDSGIQDRFTGLTTNTVTLTHDISAETDILVVWNNIVQDSSTYSVGGAGNKTLTLGGTLSSGDVVTVYYTNRVMQSVNATANSVGITELNVSDGSNGQALTTNGSGTLSFSSAGTTINTNADNRVITGSGTANTLNGETNLTFDGTQLSVLDTNAGSDNLLVKTTGDNQISMALEKSDLKFDLGLDHNNDGSKNFFIREREQDGSTTNAVRLTIDGSGNILMGKTSNDWAADGIQFEKTSGSPEYYFISTRDDGDEHITTRKNNTTGSAIKFYYNSTLVGNITQGTSSTSYGTSSDYRLKENKIAISDGIERLKTLKPYRFNFKNNKDKTVDGFFAHEVSNVVPEAISGDKDAMAVETKYTADDVETQGDNPSKKVGDAKTYSTTEIDAQSIDQSKLVPLLTSALQEAITKIETLEARVQTLENA